jgi:hypothetical protein
VTHAFEALWNDARVWPVDARWVRDYERRRVVPAARAVVGVPDEAPAPPPHAVQQEALDKLAATRAAGNSAGLVVLATGLGKTWLSAFDTQAGGFERILFVAQRDEILTQAMRTFRAIRPMASLGKYTGTEKTDDADIVFASIQTLARRQHLQRFDPRGFDYIIVDEFHHAAAQTYRRVLGHFAGRGGLREHPLARQPLRRGGADPPRRHHAARRQRLRPAPPPRRPAHHRLLRVPAPRPLHGRPLPGQGRTCGRRAFRRGERATAKARRSASSTISATIASS